jgi:hypothetical protein
MQKLIEHCDRCNEQADYLPGDVRIHLGGTTLGSTHYFDLCQDCLDDLRTFLHTQP